jgi:hypothetical protein
MIKNSSNADATTFERNFFGRWNHQDDDDDVDEDVVVVSLAGAVSEEEHDDEETRDKILVKKDDMILRVDGSSFSCETVHARFENGQSSRNIPQIMVRENNAS